jgi:hypothetical protein
MRTKTDILETTKTQLALDYNCKVSDFEKKENTISLHGLNFIQKQKSRIIWITMN